jgi:hypothetical protein
MILLVSMSALGCASSRLSTEGLHADSYQGQIVQSVTLQNGQVLVFDTEDSAHPETDIRARVQDETVVGRVDGILQVVQFSDIRELQLPPSMGHETTVLLVSVTVLTVGIFAFLYWVGRNVVY